MPRRVPPPQGRGGTTDAAGTLPPVVRRALGTRNLDLDGDANDGAAPPPPSSSSSPPPPPPGRDRIRGLEGFPLPRYLSLRAGGDCPLPPATDGSRGRAGRERAPGGAPDENAKAAGRPRKRKRKRKRTAGALGSGSGSHATSEADVAAIGEDASDGTGGCIKTQNIEGCSAPEAKSRRRRRRKRRKNARGDVAAADAEAEAEAEASDRSHGGGEWIHYETMARMIVAPYTSSSIAAVNRCRQLARAEATSDKRAGLGSEPGATPATRRAPSEEVAPGESRRPKNVYQKGASGKPRTNAFLTLSPPQESLETVVDGAVCALVRRTHRHRCRSDSKFNRNRNGNGAKLNFSYRRRRRRKESQRPSSGGAVDASASNASETSGGGGHSAQNNWLLERNLLSSGYALGSGDTLPSRPRGSGNGGGGPRGKARGEMRLHPCPHMAPGVHCLQPNALTSFARSSPLMRRLHAAIGDDAMRELLVNCVVLVPAVSRGASTMPDRTDRSVFDRGNYFQLCGPPLNVLAKRFDEEEKASATAAKVGGSVRGKRKRSDAVEEAGSLAATKVHESGRRKRTRNDWEGKAAEDRGNGKGKRDKTEEINQKESWDPNKTIPRGSLFYCDFYSKCIGLSPRHLLNQPDGGPPPSAEVKLLNAMVRLWPSVRKDCLKAGGMLAFSCNKRRGRWRRLRKSGLAMCREARRRHRRCDYARLLERHCPLPAKLTPRLPPEEFEGLDAKEALALHVALQTPVEGVGSFLEAVLRSAFPTSFWGSERNFRRVVKTVRVFTKLGRAEQIPEKAIVEGIRVLDMTWLLPPSCQRDAAKRSGAKEHPVRRHRPPKLSRSDHNSATELVRNVMRWLYRKFIIPLLRSAFYITETEFTGTRVLYYRRPVWSRIKFFSMKLLLKQQYREINAAKARKLLSSHNVGCPPAPLRLLPKVTGVRAIAMLSKACPMDDIPHDGTVTAKGGAAGVRSKAASAFTEPQSDMAPPNKILQSTFHALKYEHEKKPSLFGAGVLGLTEVFSSFCSFVEALKQKWPDFGPRSDPGGSRNLYFTSADIKHCYDTINQKRLYKLTRSVVKEDVYLTKSSFVLHYKDDDESVRCRWRKLTFPPDKYSKFQANEALAERHHDSIFVDGVHCPMEKKETIAGLLRDHIFGQVVVVSGNHRQRYLLQKDGIPQGSILSSMFCNIYFGDIERYMLNGVFPKDSSVLIRGNTSAKCEASVVQSEGDLHLLVRIVDDFLLISTSKQTSTRFLKKLNKGIPSLGVKINSDKSQVNYPVSLAHADTGKMKAVHACENFYFPWCGLLIDTRTCEISLDYQRFSGCQATDSVVVWRAGSEGCNLKKKMKDFVTPRCSQKLLFSSCVNGLGTIRVNFYHMFLLCAVKTVHYIERGRGTDSWKHQHFIYSCACDTIQFAFSLISCKLKHASSGKQMSFQLSATDALWLGRHAFFSVFCRQRFCRPHNHHYLELCHLFRVSPRTSKGKDLLAVSRRALKMFPLECFRC